MPTETLKSCPRCGERSASDAKVCAGCRHEFTEPAPIKERRAAENADRHAERGGRFNALIQRLRGR